jgi:small-conductance mechanosensitive channel
MRMLGSGLATTLEEMARKNEGVISGCLNVLLNSTLADRLWSPWITIAFSPAVAAGGILALYLIFLILFLPLFFLSYLLRPVGSFLFLLFLILVIARSLARSLAFAGSTLSVQREMSAGTS